MQTVSEMNRTDKQKIVKTDQKIVKIDDSAIKSHIDCQIKMAVQETLNAMLDAEADSLCGAAKYERSESRKDTRAGAYSRNLQTRVGTVNLKVPKLRTLKFKTAIIERYRRRESSVEEALIEMYIAGVSVRRVENITEALWGERVSPSVVSDVNKKLYERLDAWLSRPLDNDYPYIYLDGTYLKRCWSGEVRSIAILVAIGVNKEGYREVLGVREGGSENTESWKSFLRDLKSRGLSGVQLAVSDKCLGLVNQLSSFFPNSKWQRCIVHWYRNILSDVPKHRRDDVSRMLKAIHSQEDKDASISKAFAVVDKLKSLKLDRVADKVLSSYRETLMYHNFPPKHHRLLRTNNGLERLMREIKRRTKVVGAFPDGRSAVMLSAARLWHVARSKWGERRYLDMSLLYELSADQTNIRIEK